MSNPMIFSSDTAFMQIKERGQVTSARSKPRKEQQVWIRKTRTGKKEFDAEIYNVDEIVWENKKQLYGHLHDHDLVCGFESVHEWIKEIEKLNGGNIPNPLYIHHVVRKNHTLLETGDESIKEASQ